MAAKPHTRTRKAPTHVGDTAALKQAQREKAEAHKAEVEKAEAEALAKAEKLKAEAAAKQAEALARDKALEDLKPQIQSAAEASSKAEYVLGSLLMQAEDLIPSQTFQSMQAYAESVIPDYCGPIWTSSPAYRSLHAARVASVVNVKASAVDAVTPIYRVLSLDEGPKLAKAVFAEAEKVYREDTGRTRVVKVRRSDVLKALENLGLEKAAKGPKKGTKKGNGRKSRAAEKKAEASAVQEVLDAIAAVRPVEDTEATGPIVVEALGAIGKALQGHVDRHGPAAYAPGLELFTQAVRLCEKYTVPVMQAALTKRAEADKKAEPKAEPKQAEPKARTPRRTRSSRTAK